MKETNKTNYTENHNTYSGVIDVEDFSTSTPNKKRINKYQDAINLEKTIYDKEQVKKKMNTYKSMTLEELKEMKLVSNTNGRPSSDLTDEKWQQELQIRKLFVTPATTVTRMTGKYSQKPGTWNTEKYGEYSGATNWQEYCSFINDVLRNIRAGQVDYVYYIYHILDLLKFHYEDLKTRYRDGYWEVWLDK